MTLESILAIIGAVGAAASAIASALNHNVRKTQAAGEQPSKAVLAAGVAVNTLAGNVDKAVQLAKAVQAIRAAVK
jgi:hypothetical protein